MKSAPRTVAAIVVCCAGALGVGRMLVTYFTPSGAPPWALALLAAPSAVLLVAAVASSLTPSATARPRQWWLTEAPRAAWPVMLPLIPLLRWGPDSRYDPLLLPGLPLLVAAIIFTFAFTWVQPAVWAPAAPVRRILLPDAMLLAFTLAVAVLYVFVAATQMKLIGDNDGAYYFGLSRHIATTGRIEEPIVWHFLHVPERLIHAPFDYWAPMTVAVLTPPMAVFGATNTVAFVTMSVVSGVTLVLFWYLVCVALPLRHFATRLVAVVVFAFSPAMGVWRHQPESIILIHVFVLLALICYCQGRFLLSVLCGAGIFLTRTDGLMLFGLVVLANLHASGRLGLKPLRRVFFAAAGFVVLYVAWSLISFGSPTPPAPSKLVFLPSYFQVYTYGMKHERSLGLVLAKLDWSYFAARLDLALRSIRETPFIIGQDGWLVLAVLWGIPFLRGRRAQEALIWVLFFVGFALHVWLSGESFASWRAPNGYLPLLVLAGALGIDEICGQVREWTRAKNWRFVRIAAAASVMFGLVFGFAGRSRMPVHFVSSSRALQQQYMEQLQPIVQGAVVASNAPWWVLAYTTSPVVSVPFNGPEALAAVLEKYDVKYVAMWGKPPIDVQSPSREVFTRAIAEGKVTVGAFTLEQVQPLETGYLWRVSRAPSPGG